MVTMTAALRGETMDPRTMDPRTRVPTPRAGARTVTTAVPPAAASRSRWRGKLRRQPATPRPLSPAHEALVDAIRTARVAAQAKEPPVPKPEVYPMPAPGRYQALARATFDRLKPTDAPDQGPLPAATRDPFGPPETGAAAPVCPRKAGTKAAARWRASRVKRAERRAEAAGKKAAKAVEARDRAYGRALVRAAKEAKAGVRREMAEARRKTAAAEAAYRLALDARDRAVAKRMVPFYQAKRAEYEAYQARLLRHGVGDPVKELALERKRALPAWSKATAHLRERAKKEAAAEVALAAKKKRGETLTAEETYRPWRRLVEERFDPTPRKKRDVWGVWRWTPPLPKPRPTTRAERDTDPAVALTLRRRTLARRGAVRPRGVPLDPLGALAPRGPTPPKGGKGSGSR